MEILQKTINIPLSNDRTITLLFTKPVETANWVCQSTSEALDDMQKILDGNLV